MQAKRFTPLVSLLALLAAATPARSDNAPTVSPVLGMMNDRLAQRGLNVRVVRAELVAAFHGNPVGITIVANPVRSSA